MTSTSTTARAVTTGTTRLARRRFLKAPRPRPLSTPARARARLASRPRRSTSTPRRPSLVEEESTSTRRGRSKSICLHEGGFRVFLPLSPFPSLSSTSSRVFSFLYGSPQVVAFFFFLVLSSLAHWALSRSTYKAEKAPPRVALATLSFIPFSPSPLIWLIFLSFLPRSTE